MRVVIKADKELARFANAIGYLGKKAPFAIQQAVAKTGDRARTRVKKALAAQTGLSQKTIDRALKVKRPSFKDFTYTITSRGEDIGLQHFKARETRKGVVAHPWGKKTLYPGAFLKAGGRWKKVGGTLRPATGWDKARVGVGQWNGNALKRTGDGMERQTSGVVIPQEMVDGASLAAFKDGLTEYLAKRLDHEIGRLLPK